MGIMQSEFYGGLYIGHAPTAELLMTRASQIRLHYLGLQRLQMLFYEILRGRFRGLQTRADVTPFLKTTHIKLNRVPEPKTWEIPSCIALSSHPIIWRLLIQFNNHRCYSR